MLETADHKRAMINIIFCSDDALLEINQLYLSHDYYTDIITFDLSDNRKEKLLSDIYISTERVKDNAQHLNTPMETELLRVIFHGVLHLLGFKDKTSHQQKEMRKKEEEWLTAYKDYKSREQASKTS